MALSLAMILCELAPFDFVRNTAELHGSFRTAHLHPYLLTWNFWTWGWELADGAWFALLGCLAAGGALRNRAQPMSAWGAGFQQGAIVAVLIECLQLLTRSHVFDMATLMLRLCAALMGSWSAAFCHSPAPLTAARGKCRSGQGGE